jgi:serine/threonine protein kinase/Flp pilus assembly protein TadD
VDRESFARIQELFWQALDTEPSNRQTLLAAVRAQEAELADEVESLLAADARADEFLAGPPGDVLGALERLTESGALDSSGFEPPSRVGQYTIVRVLGEGGIGVVYLARQTQPVRRDVALKVIKPGMDTREVITRFEAERQALAVMDHPNIAKVFDGGITESGRPYFVMELVRGVPITDYCDSNRLSVPERLRIFADACLVVQHAHQKGVIHRDLKPSNILVTVQDGRPVPKVIDFGIAKAVGGHLTDATLQTAQGTIIGTPAYMSPEQAGVTELDVDTRADIYSLGVVLYELLTGVLPFARSDLQGIAVVATLRDTEPPIPSARFRSLGDRQKAIAERRRMEPGALRRRLEGDLDRVTMKAMAKDRTKRYETANGFALDVGRHLNDEPVLARALDSRAYRLGKLVKRNRVQTVAVILAVLSLIGGLGGALWEASLARNERDRSQAARMEAEVALGQLEEVTDLLIGLFEFADPREANVEHSAASELVRQGLRQAEAVTDQPEVQARMFDAMGRVYTNLGEYEQAEQLLERALRLRRSLHGDRDPKVAESLDHLAELLRRRGEYTRADTLLGEALAILRDTVDAAHPALARTLWNRGKLMSRLGRPDAAEAMHREVLWLSDSGLDPENPVVAENMISLAAVLRSAGRLEEAEAYAREALSLHRRARGPDHPDVAEAMVQLGDLLVMLGDFGEAESLFREALAMLRRMDEGGQALFHPLSSLGGLLAELGRYEEAEALYRESVELRRETYGPNNTNVAEGMDHLASVLVEQHKYEEAESIKRQALAIWRAAMGDRSLGVAGSLAGLAQLLVEKGELEESEALFRQVTEIREALIPDHPGRALDLAELADVLRHQGKFEEAERLALEALEIALRHYDASAPSAQRVYATLTELYDDWGKPSEAARYRRRLSK